MGRQAAKQRGRTKPQVLRFSSSSPTPERQLSQIGGDASSEALTFMRRPIRERPLTLATHPRKRDGRATLAALRAASTGA